MYHSALKKQSEGETEEAENMLKEILEIEFLTQVLYILFYKDLQLISFKIICFFNYNIKFYLFMHMHRMYYKTFAPLLPKIFISLRHIIPVTKFC